jgi:hypothetical protein
MPLNREHPGPNRVAGFAGLLAIADLPRVRIVVVEEPV